VYKKTNVYKTMMRSCKPNHNSIYKPFIPTASLRMIIYRYTTYPEGIKGL